MDAVTPMGVGKLGYYLTVAGGPVKVQVREVQAGPVGWQIRVVVTARTHPTYRRGEVIWTSGAWLTDRRNRYFLMPSHREMAATGGAA